MKRSRCCLLRILFLGSVLGTVSSPSVAETTQVTLETVRWVSPLEIERVTQTIPDAKAELGNRVDRFLAEGFIALEKLPVATAEIIPKYPQAALDLGLEAEVVLQVFVDNTGTVRRARVTQESGYTYDTGFEKAALTAAITGSFSPALRDGKPVGVWTTLPLKFKLN